MIIGLDIGNITSIVCAKNTTIIKESRIKVATEMDKLSSNEVFEFEGTEYVTESGDFENNLLKYEKENFLPLTFYMLGKAILNTVKKPKGTTDIELIIGIPASQYNNAKTRFIEVLEKNAIKEISIMDRVVKIDIRKVKVVPEGYAIKTINLKDKIVVGAETLVVDIGGGTTDTAEFDENMNFKGGTSIKCGLLNLYKEAKKTLEDVPFNMVIGTHDAKKYFDGERQIVNNVNPNWKQPIMLEFIKSLNNNLVELYPNIQNMNVIFCGGGASKVYPTLKKVYTSTCLIESVEYNANGFYNIGEKLWDN